MWSKLQIALNGLIPDMRDTHCKIFCQSKKKFDCFFSGANTMETAYLGLRNGCRAYHEFNFFYKSDRNYNFIAFF